MSEDSFSRSGTVLQAIREDNHVSLAIDCPDLPVYWGERLRVQANDVTAEVFYHGSMKAWSSYRRVFGQEALAKLTADPGIDAYVEGSRTMGGKKVPDQDEWLRLRAALDGQLGFHPLFQVAPGASISISRCAAPAIPAKPKSSKMKDGMIGAVVLASHPHGLTLNVDLPLLRKLQAPPEAWYELEINGKTIPVLGRRGLSLAQQDDVWSRPNALLFDFEGHWIFEKLTVMALAPMQMNWRGKFPEATQVTTEYVEAGTVVPLRFAAA